MNEEEQKEAIPYREEIQSQISEADDIIIFKRRNPAPDWQEKPPSPGFRWKERSERKTEQQLRKEEAGC